MTGPMYSSGPQVDEKHQIQPQESSELDHGHSHQEVIEKGSDEAQLHESEKDIPVSRCRDRWMLLYADDDS